MFAGLDGVRLMLMFLTETAGGAVSFSSLVCARLLGGETEEPAAKGPGQLPLRGEAGRRMQWRMWEKGPVQLGGRAEGRDSRASLY